MSLGFTFGSVGDIISLSLIIKDLVKALDDCDGASAEYQEIIRELWTLDRVLLEVELLSRNCKESIELNALRVTARRLVDQCRGSMEAFLNKVQRYIKSLKDGGSGNLMRDITMKVQWQVLHSNDIVKLRAEIAAHCSAINMLLITASVNQVHINGDKIHVQNLRNEALFQEQNTLLSELRNEMESVKKVSQTSRSTTNKILKMLKVEWLHKLGQEVKDIMRKIFYTNLATYRAVLDIRGQLPSQLERSLYQEPFILEDSIGRIAPVHMQFISSWEAFDSVMELRFEGLQGHRMVQKQQYILQRKDARSEIKRSKPWQAAFLPGQRVIMSMYFNSLWPTPSKTCPGCRTPTEKATDADVTCALCGLCYRRVVELDEIGLTSTYQPAQMHGTWLEAPSERLIESISGVKGPASHETSTRFNDGQKRKAHWISDDSDIRNFKRVHIVYNGQKLAKNPLVTSYQGDSSGARGREHEDHPELSYIDSATYANIDENPYWDPLVRKPSILLPDEGSRRRERFQEFDIYEYVQKGDVVILTNAIAIAEPHSRREELKLIAFEAAVQLNGIDTMRQLLEIYPDFATTRPQSWDLPALAARYGNIEIEEKLLFHIISSKRSSHQGFSPLHLAAWRGQVNVIEFLVEQGADLDAEDADGRTPLDHALSKQRYAASKVLKLYHQLRVKCS